jgi:hypothetical protein
MTSNGDDQRLFGGPVTSNREITYADIETSQTMEHLVLPASIPEALCRVSACKQNLIWRNAS